MEREQPFYRLVIKIALPESVWAGSEQGIFGQSVSAGFACGGLYRDMYCVSGTDYEGVHKGCRNEENCVGISWNHRFFLYSHSSFHASFHITPVYGSGVSAPLCQYFRSGCQHRAELCADFWKAWFSGAWRDGSGPCHSNFPDGLSSADNGFVLRLLSKTGV